MPRGQVNLLSCAKIVASIAYYQQGKGPGDALMHLRPPPHASCLLPAGEGARWCTDAPDASPPHTSCLLLAGEGGSWCTDAHSASPPPHMWTRLTGYLRWLILLCTRRDKGRGSSTPPHMFMHQSSNISPPDQSTFSSPTDQFDSDFPASNTNIQTSCFWHFVPPPSGGRAGRTWTCMVMLK